MKVLPDSDVLIDVATARAPFAADSGAVLNWCELHPGNGFVAWHTISNLYYILRPKLGVSDTRRFIHDLLVFVEVIPTGTAHAKHALALPLEDFEDAMQSAAAVAAGVDFVVTRNVADYLRSPIPAVLPGTFVAQAPS